MGEGAEQRAGGGGEGVLAVVEFADQFQDEGRLGLGSVTDPGVAAGGVLAAPTARVRWVWRSYQAMVSSMFFTFSAMCVQHGLAGRNLWMLSSAMGVSSDDRMPPKAPGDLDESARSIGRPPSGLRKSGNRFSARNPLDLDDHVL